MQSGFTEIERKFLIDAFPRRSPPAPHPAGIPGLPLPGSGGPSPPRRAGRAGRRPLPHHQVRQRLVRREVRIDLSREQFDALAELIPQPFISKDYRVYRLPGGLELECSLVDEGTDTAFLYAEIEFPSVEAAKAFPPLPLFKQEVTENPAYRMNRYWKDTRG